jgi:putative flippase GtrA
MKTALQFSKYGGIAVGSAMLDYAVFSILYFVGAGAMPSQMVARLSGGAFSFVLNKFWCFEAASRRTVVREGRRFLMLYAFSYGLSLGVLYTLNDRLNVPVYPAKILADVTCFVINFIVMKRYVFSATRGLRDRVGAFLKSP